MAKKREEIINSIKSSIIINDEPYEGDISSKYKVSLQTAKNYINEAYERIDFEKKSDKYKKIINNSINLFKKKGKIDYNDLQKKYKVNKDYALMCINEINQIIRIEKEEKEKEKIETISKRGNTFFEIGELNKSLECYEKLLKIKKKDIYFLEKKALILLKLKRYEDALECYNDIISLNFNHEIAFINKGFILLQFKKYNDALICFEKAIIINSTSENGLLNKGIIYYIYKEYNNALKLFNKVLYYYPNNKIALNKKKEIELLIISQLEEKRKKEKAEEEIIEEKRKKEKAEEEIIEEKRKKEILIPIFNLIKDYYGYIFLISVILFFVILMSFKSLEMAFIILLGSIIGLYYHFKDKY
jgi:tetratricopeptide (TPR) repeat protein